ncbi:unnamed protein product [Symbiodinium sp. KB8]|nr:unnamed protein product [Symbiodinium sp. KB8]
MSSSKVRTGLGAAAAVNCTECWDGGFAWSESCCKACPAQCPSGNCTWMHSQGYKCFDPTKEVACYTGTDHRICEKSQVCPSCGSCSGARVRRTECGTCPPGQRPDESHCNCISEQLAANHIVDVGNHACPTSMAPLNASKECAAAAEVVWPGRGCYGLGWKEIVQTPADGREYPQGCMFEEAAGGGCALLFNPGGQAEKCPDGSTCSVLCSDMSCVAVGKPCDPKNNACCKEAEGKFGLQHSAAMGCAASVQTEQVAKRTYKMVDVEVVMRGEASEDTGIHHEVGSSVSLESYGTAKQHRSSFYEKGSTEEIFDKLAPKRLDHEVHLRKMKKFLKDVETFPCNFQNRVESSRDELGLQTTHSAVATRPRKSSAMLYVSQRKVSSTVAMSCRI